MSSLDKKAISNIRIVTQEMITNAKSGHPGIALGAAPIMHVLFSKVLKITSDDSKWPNRDRFVLAAGHGSSLLYVMLHLKGFKVSIEDLKDFRKLDSITPGHPELGVTDGVDCTSGPLGQGIPTAVGLAISEKFLSKKYNREGFSLFDHYTYVLCGDGDLQEGVTVEALSVAGNLCLNKLIILYDSNDIQLDGKVNECNTENVKIKVESMGFNYLRVDDGEDTDSIYEAISCAQKSDKPTLIEIKTIIGKTSSQENSCSVHGAPLSLEEVNKMRKDFGGAMFDIDSDVYSIYQSRNQEINSVYKNETKIIEEYAEKYPTEYVELDMFYNNKDIISKDDLDMDFEENSSKATRYSAGEVVSKISELNPVFIGGSADLTKSTYIKGSDGNFSCNNNVGRNICFGVREHSMASICNGITLNGITRAFCGGFFVFSDYMKPAIRMAALMDLPVLYFFTHDSIAVGEDGPTHEPIEQLTMLRSIPNLNVFRPSGKEEVKEAIVLAYNSKSHPTAIVLSRQGLKETRTYENCKENLSSNGAYVVKKEKDRFKAIILATGSEVELAVEAANVLEKEGIDIRVVSMPSMFLFDRMSKEYQESVLPSNSIILGLEMGEAAHMYKYVKNGKVFNINTFGSSGKANDVLNKYGFTVANIVNEVKNIIK